MKKTQKLSTEKLENELKTKEKELAIFYKVIKEISSLDLEQVLAEIVKTTSKLSMADSCLIYLLDSTKKELVLRASKNPHKKLLKKIKMKLGEGITGWVAEKKKPVVICENAAKDSRFKFFHQLPEDRYEAFLSVPIVNKHGTVGVINIQHKKKHRYSEEEINLLTAIGQLAGGAVENARLVEESLALKEALETRKILEKAKGILMKDLKITEEEAFRRIQKKSMDLRKSFREIAEAIVMADNLKKMSLDN